jgi:hypothetical protein
VSSLPVTPAPRRKWPVVVAIGVVLLILGGIATERLRFESPDRGFRSETDHDLPANVVATAHASEITDNFFHTSHYWLLQGPEANLRELAPAFGLRRSDEDAKEVLRSLPEVMSLGEPPVLVEGYEGSLDGGRDRWLLVMQPGDRAVFVY